MNIWRTNNYRLRLALGEGQPSPEDRYAIKVLQKRNIEGLLPLRKRNIDGNCFLDYSVLGLHTMQEAWEGRLLTESDLNIFFLSLKQTLLHIKDFLLDCRRLSINPSYIMYDAVKNEWQFLYIIGPYENQQNDIEELLEFFISKIEGMNTDNSIIYEYLSDCLQFEDGLSPDELVSSWEERKYMTGAEEEILQETINNEWKEAKRDENTEIENVKQAAKDSMDEQACTRRDRWNEIIYGKLYLVPFSPH